MRKFILFLLTIAVVQVTWAQSPIEMTESPQNDTQSSTNTDVDSDYSKFKLRVGYSGYPKMDTWSLDYTILALRRITGPLYCGTGLGYSNSNSLSYNNSPYLDFNCIDYTGHSLNVPIKLGITAPWSGNVAVNIYTGPRFDLLIAAKFKFKDSGEVIDKMTFNEYYDEIGNKPSRFKTNWVFGGGIELFGFEIGAQYILNLIKRSEVKDTYDCWSVYISACF